MPCVQVCVNNFCILMYRHKSRVRGVWILLKDGLGSALRDDEDAEILVKLFMRIHSSLKIDEEGKIKCSKGE